MSRLCGGAVFRTSAGEIIFQQRENRPDINSPGMVHVFGGKAEAGESGREAMIREIIEETGLPINILEEAVFIDTFEEEPSTDGVENTVSMYVIDIDDGIELRDLEGEGLVRISESSNLSEYQLSGLGRQVLQALGFKEDAVG